jgi:hypothetical protein
MSNEHCVDSSSDPAKQIVIDQLAIKSTSNAEKPCIESFSSLVRSSGGLHISDLHTVGVSHGGLVVVQL